LQWCSRLKVSFCEIFGVVQFSTFATQSALFGHGAMSDLSPLSAAKQTSRSKGGRSGFDPEQTFADPGNSRVARDMRRVDMETEREGSHDLRNSWLG
jgi:hypothetical protein